MTRRPDEHAAAPAHPPPPHRPAARAPFKPAPRRFWPKGLAILHEDHDLVVVDKAAGLLTISTDRIERETAYFRLTDYVRRGNAKRKDRIFVVHRLDRDTSGVLVFAKHAAAKEFLQTVWPRFRKHYVAVVRGRPPQAEGVLESRLAESETHRMYAVAADREGKLARTRYRVVQTSPHYSLLDIELLTGRKNQIRVQFADAGCPVVGDTKYGGGAGPIRRLALHAVSVSLVHPALGSPMTFTAPPPPAFAALLRHDVEPPGPANRIG